jgi:hypothetical protein
MSKPTTTSHFRKPLANLLTSISSCSQQVFYFIFFAYCGRVWFMVNASLLTLTIFKKIFARRNFLPSKNVCRNMYSSMAISLIHLDEETMVTSFLPVSPSQSWYNGYLAVPHPNTIEEPAPTLGTTVNTFDFDNIVDELHDFQYNG